MSKGYVLKANTNEGPAYYMNVICMTEEKECAEVFPTKEAAEAKAEYFKNFFHYESPKIEVEEV